MNDPEQTTYESLSSGRDMIGMLCLAPSCPGTYQPACDSTIVNCDVCGIGIPRWLTKRHALAWAMLLAGSAE